VHLHTHVHELVGLTLRSKEHGALVELILLHEPRSKGRLVHEATVDHVRLILVHDRSVLHLDNLVLKVVYLHLVLLHYLLVNQLGWLKAHWTKGIVHLANVGRVVSVVRENHFGLQFHLALTSDSVATLRGAPPTLSAYVVVIIDISRLEVSLVSLGVLHLVHRGKVPLLLYRFRLVRTRTGTVITVIYRI